MVSSTAETQRRAHASIRARFHQLEDAAVGEVRRTVLEAARGEHSDRDCGPQIRLNAATDLVRDVNTLAKACGVNLSLGGVEVGSFDSEQVEWCNEEAQKHAAEILNRKLGEALQEIKAAMGYRLPAPDKLHTHIVIERPPRDRNAAAIAALAVASPEGVYIRLDELSALAGQRIRNLTWEMVTRHGVGIPTPERATPNRED